VVVIDVVPSDEVGAAAWIGPRLHPFTNYDAGIVMPGGFDGYARIDHERVGVLPPDVASALIDILVRYTAAAEILWLAIWEGYGHMVGPPVIDQSARSAPLPRGPAEPAPVRRLMPPRPPRGTRRIHIPHRNYMLYRGRPDQVVGWIDGPNLWWPDDRAWCVASDIDLPWTYVGGSKALVAAVLAEHVLHALPASLDEITLVEPRA